MGIATTHRTGDTAQLMGISTTLHARNSSTDGNSGDTVHNKQLIKLMGIATTLHARNRSTDGNSNYTPHTVHEKQLN